MNNIKDSLLVGFLENEKLKGNGKPWLYNLKCKLPKLLNFLDNLGVDFCEVKISHAMSFQKMLVETVKKDGAKYASGTIIGYMGCAMLFFDYLKKENIVYINPFQDVRRVREEFKIPKNILKEKEVNTLLNSLKGFTNELDLWNKRNGYRYHVLAELMYSTGLRIAEATNLKISDIDFDNGIVNVIDGKGGKDRVCFLNEYALKIVKIYVDEMRESVIHERGCKKDTIFGVSSNQLSKGFNKYLKKKVETLGITGFTSHSFRHCLGFHFLRRGCDIRYIKEFLGHGSLRSTQIYTKVDKDDLKGVLDLYHPRSLKRVKSERA